MTGFVPDAAT